MQTRGTPTLESRRYIGKNLRLQNSINVTLLPDLALQGFQPWRLAILINQPVNVSDERTNLRFARLSDESRCLRILLQVCGVLRTEEHKVIRQFLGSKMFCQ